MNAGAVLAAAISLLSLAVAAPAPPAPGPAAAAGPTGVALDAGAGFDAFDRQAVDDLVREQLAATGVPGAAVALTHGDRVLYVQGYGEAGHGRPVTARTQFRIASLSKSFTATAALQLVTAGQVDLDAPVANYLPAFTLDDPRGDSITVRHLLNQTSGITDRTFPAAALPQPQTLAERVESLRTAGQVTDPGTHYAYFNPNYSVLARLVEVVSGEPFDAYLRTHVFDPLGMDDTFTATTSTAGAAAATNLAQGHILLFGGAHPRPELDGFLGGYGGVVSTAADLAHWLILNSQGGRWSGRQILSPRAVDLMHTPPGGVNGEYAMGWWVTEGSDGPAHLEHNGVLSTFYAEQALVPSAGFGVVVLYNCGNALAGYHQLTTALVDLLLDRPSGISGVEMRWIGFGLAVLAALVLMLRVRALLRVRRWVLRSRARPVWRVVPGLLWLLAPTAVLACLPALVTATSGRVFTREQLFWAMPSITVLLAVAAVTGIVLAAARGVCGWRARREAPLIS